MDTDFATAGGTCECPACAEPIAYTDVLENEIIECEVCGGEFEVLNLDPFNLVEVGDDEEDWGE